jgi:hypothetical protein
MVGTRRELVSKFHKEDEVTCDDGDKTIPTFCNIDFSSSTEIKFGI